MQERKYCNPEDMVRFLLSLCCQDDSSTTGVSRDDTVDGRFENCLRAVTAIANSRDLWERLDRYKSSASTEEMDEYQLFTAFTEALNHALEHLADIKVDGLPGFNAHIVFALCNNVALSHHDVSKSSSKPDIAVMLIEDARKLYELKHLQADEPEVSQFTSEAKGKTTSRSTSWNSLLSAVEVTQNEDVSTWAALKEFGPRGKQVCVMPSTDTPLGEESGGSRPTTPVSSANLALSKRSASAAGMDASSETPSGKQRLGLKVSIKKATRTLTVRDGKYAAAKFSDSFTISHALNLLIQNDCLWISWTDREGAIFSSGFSFFGNLPLMLVLLLVLQRFGRRQWGYISELTTTDHSISLHPVNLDGTLSTDEVDIDFDPDDKVHSSWALLGRATTVVGAKRHKRDGNGTAEGERTDYVPDTKVKAYGDDIVGIPEEGSGASSGADEELRKKWNAFYEDRNRYRKAFSNKIKSHPLVLKVSWPETSRVEEWKIIKHAHALGKEDKFIEGHIPEVRYARDLDRYSTRHIRTFLGLPDDGGTGTRTLRLIVMNRLRPIFDLDGEEFWNAFWQCVACHYRLWVNGIRHGDISLGNLMCDFPTGTGSPVGILNDFDLATWVGHRTTNNDRTGTIPFMALDMLKGELDGRIPRLYRHDLESFSWVLGYVTVAYIEYKDHTIEDSPVGDVKMWFKDKDEDDREAHISSKQLFHENYGRFQQRVSGRYHDYRTVIRKITQYWHDFYVPPDFGEDEGDLLPNPQIPEKSAPSEPEDDEPAGLLKSFIEAVERSLKEGDRSKGFAVVKNLLEAIEIPVAGSSSP